MRKESPVSVCSIDTEVATNLLEVNLRDRSGVAVEFIEKTREF